jgi:hypothetical protein
MPVEAPIAVCSGDWTKRVERIPESSGQENGEPCET